MLCKRVLHPPQKSNGSPLKSERICHGKQAIHEVSAECKRVPLTMNQRSLIHSSRSHADGCVGSGNERGKQNHDHWKLLRKHE